MDALPSVPHAPSATTAWTVRTDLPARHALASATTARLALGLTALTSRPHAAHTPPSPLPPLRHDAGACVQHAEQLLALHRPGEVLDALDRLDAGLPRGAAWHLARASALSTLRDDPQAARAASAALADPHAPSGSGLHRRALLQLGHALTRLQAHADAAWCYRSALAKYPHAVDAALHAALGSAAVLDWEQLPADLDRLLATAQSAMQATAPLTPQVWLDPSALLPLLDDPALLRWCAELACAQRQGSRPHASRPRPRVRSAPRQGRWRLGVLMGGRGRAREDHHPPALDLFSWFDRTEVELYFYSDAWADLPGTPLRHPLLRTHASAWHNSRHLGTDDLVGVVRGDRIDLLLDLSGGGEDTRLNVLAQRPAPVQVAWTHHAGTTGAPWIDYLIGDPVTTPLASQPEFNECLAQLPQRPPRPRAPTPTAASTTPPPTRAACGLPERAPVLACLTRPERLNPAQFQQWCVLLQALPEAVLWLLAPPVPAQLRLREHLRSASLDPQRLVFAPWQPPADHLARLPLADLVLDPSPGNAETAAREALQAGVPVLTLTGRAAPTRRTAALLHRLGLPMLVCTTHEQVQQNATALLHTPHTLAAVRTHLRHALADGHSPADQRRQALDLQHLLWRMLAREDAGLPPAPLAAAPATRRS